MSSMFTIFVFPVIEEVVVMRIIGDEAVAVKMNDFLFILTVNGGESRECSLEIQREIAFQ